MSSSGGIYNDGEVEMEISSRVMNM
uniref:Uncharacterized protein n=1 Tax=Nymphaea colorata TaxID=210225 RepID=A0A5K0UXT8_9MAGN